MTFETLFTGVYWVRVGQAVSKPWLYHRLREWREGYSKKEGISEGAGGVFNEIKPCTNNHVSKDIFSVGINIMFSMKTGKDEYGKDITQGSSRCFSTDSSNMESRWQLTLIFAFTSIHVYTWSFRFSCTVIRYSFLFLHNYTFLTLLVYFYLCLFTNNIQTNFIQ